MPPRPTSNQTHRRAGRILPTLLFAVAAAQASVASSNVSQMAPWTPSASTVLIALLGAALSASFLGARARARRGDSPCHQPVLQLLSRIPLSRGRYVYSVRFGEAAIAVLISEPEKSAVVLAETRMPPERMRSEAVDPAPSDGGPS